MPVTYEPIATTTVNPAAATVVFSSIPNTYTDLRLVIYALGTTAGETEIRVQFNSDAGTNYSYTRLTGTGASASSGRATTSANGLVGWMIQSSETMSIVDIFSYAGSTFKTFIGFGAYDQNTSGSGGVINTVNLWRSTSAINSITLSTSSGNYNAGCRITLYGILKA